MPIMIAALLTLLPFGVTLSCASVIPATAVRMLRCASTSSFTSFFQSASVEWPSAGRTNQFEPSSENEPRASERIRRRTMYFQ